MEIPIRAEMTEMTAHKRRLLGEAKLSRKFQNVFVKVSAANKINRGFQVERCRTDRQYSVKGATLRSENWIEQKRQRIAH